MFNVFDIGIILILISFIVVGFKKGVIKELVSLVGIIIVFILAWNLKGIIGNFLCINLPFIEFKGVIKDITSLNIMLYQTIAFILVFSILLGIYSISLKISRLVQKLVNMTIILLIPSKILGGVVSFIKGYLILFVTFVFLIIPLGEYTIFKDSTFINIMLYKTPIISKYTSKFTKPVNDIIDLGKSVNNNEIASQDANKKAIEIMLEYNIVDNKTIDKLYDLNKLERIEKNETH